MSTESVLKHHLEAFGAGSVDELLKDYTESSVLIAPEGPVKGLDNLRGLFTKFVTEILPPGSDFEMKAQHVDGEAAYIFWKASSKAFDVPFGTDTFIVRDGKIVIQTFCGEINPK